MKWCSSTGRGRGNGLTAATGIVTNIKASVDHTGDTPTSRVFASVGLQHIPAEVRGRLAITDKGVLTQAEFHGCVFDWDHRTCPNSNRNCHRRGDQGEGR